MPYLKTENIFVTNGCSADNFKARIYVNSSGEFYCRVPERLAVALKDIYRGDDKPKLFAGSLDSLVDKLWKALTDINQPITTTERVIRYNIESHISFAENANGEIFPNAHFDGAEWPRAESKYGGHHAASPAENGYSLIIGAKASIKKTIKYGDKKKVEYAPYYPDGDHFSTNNPAGLLNSWVSFALPDDFKEIPYSDEAATFFHNLMLGMAKLSQQIQKHTFDESKLLELIASGSNLLSHDNHQEEIN